MAAGVRDTELGVRIFAALRRQTEAAWNRELSRITITGPRAGRAMLVTALFRVMQMPVQIADPGERFRGSGGSRSGHANTGCGARDAGSDRYQIRFRHGRYALPA